MKRILTFLACCLSMTAWAQWELPTTSQQSQEKQQVNTPTQQDGKEYKYAYYLGDVVPMVDEQVVWEKTFTNEASADANYEAMLTYLNELTHEENQTEQSMVALVNKAEHSIACRMEEWLTFSSSLISLDRAKMVYTLAVFCADGSVRIKAYRIHYIYPQQHRKDELYLAEEWITDEYAVNKKHTRLLPHSGKFRRKTVDRMEELMKNFELHVKVVR
ncbi:MAG: DUF4468 domain-containing protein [Prevotella sp.]|nr:DUF4468 domain-containing protein [Prevotella sp.]